MSIENVDMVQVVRCKNCKWYESFSNMNEDILYLYRGAKRIGYEGICHNVETGTNGDDFCSSGVYEENHSWEF